MMKIKEVLSFLNKHQNINTYQTSQIESNEYKINFQEYEPTTVKTKILLNSDKKKFQ